MDSRRLASARFAKDGRHISAGQANALKKEDIWQVHIDAQLYKGYCSMFIFHIRTWDSLPSKSVPPVTLPPVDLVLTRLG